MLECKNLFWFICFVPREMGLSSVKKQIQRNPGPLGGFGKDKDHIRNPGELTQWKTFFLYKDGKQCFRAPPKAVSHQSPCSHA